MVAATGTASGVVVGASLGKSIAGRVSSRTPMTAIAAKMTATCDE